MKTKPSFFILMTSIMVVVVICVVSVRFGIQQNFIVSFQDTCNPDKQGSCEEVTCDDTYTLIFGCKVDESLSIQKSDLSYHDFISRIQK